MTIQPNSNTDSPPDSTPNSPVGEPTAQLPTAPATPAGDAGGSPPSSDGEPPAWLTEIREQIATLQGIPEAAANAVGERLSAFKLPSSPPSSPPATPRAPTKPRPPAVVDEPAAPVGGKLARWWFG